MKCCVYFNTLIAMCLLHAKLVNCRLPSNVACGVRYSSQAKSLRIIGGQRAVSGNHPWQAYILKSGKQHCGGTVVDREWILTAAHCLYQIGEPLKVLVGSYQYRNIFNRGHFKNIIRRVLHPNFNPTVNYQNDIALIKIGPPITYTAGDRYGRGAIVPVCLPTQNQQFTGITSARVSGYGLTQEKGRPSPMLNTVKVQILPPNGCSRYTGMRQLNPNTQICAGYPNGGRDSCQGDSGGPLGIVWNDRVTQIGIVSFGQGCGRKGYPGIYTRVAAFRNWIESVLNS